MYKTRSFERYIAVKTGTELFFDFVEMNKHYQVIWTDDISKAFVIDKIDDEKLYEILDACGVMSEITIIPMTITLKISSGK